MEPGPTSSDSLEIALSPGGHLLAEPSAEAESRLGAAAVSRLSAAFTASSAQGLELLAADFLHTPLPASLGFWRDLARQFFTALCHRPGLEDPAKLSVPVPTNADLTTLAEAAPPMRGLEYLDAATLARLWAELEVRVRDEIQRAGGGVQAYLRAQNPVWNAVGRVTFHLAENKRSPEQPFAFLATYTQRVSDAGQAQHIPLGRALQEYAGAQNRAALTTLLSPVQRAAEKSKLARELLDSRAIFHPQAWPPAQAYRLLKEIPLLEESGIIVRIPDWWKAGRPPRPQVSVRIGDRGASLLGKDGLLDFKVEMSLDGDPLTEAEWQTILNSTAGLVLLKGKWVEADRDQLQEVLAHWKKVQAAAGADGVSLLQGMRMLSGFDPNRTVETETETTRAEWSSVAAGDWLRRALEEIQNPQAGAESDPGSELHGELRPYQRLGVHWLWYMNRLRLGACLADDMGLGKTIQVLSLLLVLKRQQSVMNAGPPHEPERRAPARHDARQHVRAEQGLGAPNTVQGFYARDLRSGNSHPGPLPQERENRLPRAAGRDDETPEHSIAPSFLVVPASLIANWKNEIRKFAPSLSVFFAHPSETPADALAAVARDPAKALAGRDLVITSYALLLRSPWMKELEWNLVVLDEAQAIKNSGARQTRAVKELRARGRIALSGTPIENSLSDLWSLFDFLCPGLLGGAKEFAGFVKSRSKIEHGQFAPLRRLVRPYILRRLKTDKRIINDLPDKTELNAFCNLTRPQAVLYQQAVQELAERLESPEVEGIQRRGIILAFLTRFKQLCNHPSQWLGDGAYDPAHSGKFHRLRELSEEILARQEKVLVFSQYREINAPLARFLGEIFGRPGLVLTGETAVKKRQQLVDDFQRDSGPPFFVLSLKAGGTGLNLTAASHVIHFDRWWNPAVENQATDRAFRIGQKKNVMVHKFICRGTLEERIHDLIASKLSLAEDILGEGAERLFTEMNNSELLKFVALDIKTATEQ